MTKIKSVLGILIDSIKLIKEITVGVTYDNYVGNTVLKLALVKLIEIIEEAMSKITNQTKLTYNEVRWRDITATRHILVHDYNIINYDMLWEILKSDLDILELQMMNIYENLK